jgi:hypothetical protein
LLELSLLGGIILEIGNLIGAFFAYYLLVTLVFISPIWGLGLLFLNRKIYSSFSNPDSKEQGKWSLRFIRVSEFFFGFMNPVVYLFFIYPALFDQDHVFWRMLFSLSLVFVGFLWFMRLHKPRWASGMASNVPVRMASFLVMALIVVHALAIVFFSKNFNWGWEYLLIIPSFTFVIPFLLAFKYFICSSTQASSERFKVEDLFYFNWQRLKSSWYLGLGARVFQGAAIAIVCSPFLILVKGNAFNSDEEIKGFIQRNKLLIEESAKSNGLDPKVLASVLYTAKKETDPWKPKFEHFLSGVWASDDHNHFFLNQSLNLSIGPAQIKPLTAQTAIFLYYNNYHYLKFGSHSGQIRESKTIGTTDQNIPSSAVSGYPMVKEYRGVWSESWKKSDLWSLPESFWQQVVFPFSEFPNRFQLVESLNSEEGSIRFCAFILGLYRIHWASNPGAVALEARPDILATLYQIGFERSSPKPNPEPSRFGKAVSRVLREEWMTATF